MQRQAPPGAVWLAPLTESEFEAYLAQAVAGYAAEHVRAGNWHPEEALERSRRTFADLLPQGVATPKQHLYAIVDRRSGEHVGVIWFCAYDERQPPRAFIYDFVIDEPRRGRGYGAQALRALEDEVRVLGIQRIELHVFAHNTIAQSLYGKLGYVVTDLHMAKELQS